MSPEGVHIVQVARTLSRECSSQPARGRFFPELVCFLLFEQAQGEAIDPGEIFRCIDLIQTVPHVLSRPWILRILHGTQGLPPSRFHPWPSG